MLHVGLGGLGDGFAVGHLGLAHVGVDVEFAGQAVNDDLQMQFAHAGDEGLVGLLVALDAEGGVFLGQLVEGGGQGVTVGLGLGLDGHFDDGLGDVQGFQDHRALFVAQGVAGGSVLQAHQGHDVTGACPLDVFTLVGVHLQDAADAFLLAGVGVVHAGAGLQAAGVDAEEGQVADEGVGEQLEHQAGKGFLVVAGAFDEMFFVAGLMAGHDGDVHGRGQVVHHGVQQGLHAHVAESGTAEHGHDVAGDGGLADAGNDLVAGQVFAAQVLFQQGLIFFGHGFDEFVALFLEEVLQFGGHGFVSELGALGALVEAVGLAFDEVHDAFKFVFGADGQLQGHGLGAQAFVDHAHAAEEVGADAVHLVHEADAGHVVAVGLAPHGLGLGLDAGHGVEHAHGTVQHAQGTFHFDGEVHVAGGVDDVDAAVLPEAGGGGGGDGDAALLFLFHPVHGGLTVVGFADLVGNTGVEKDAFGGGGFAGVNMGHDADIALFVYGGGAGHGILQKRGSGAGGKAPRPCGRGSSHSEAGLPAVVGESLVGFGHTVGIFALFHRAAATVVGVQQFSGKLGGHALFAARTGIVDQPADGQGNLAFGPDFHGHLVGGAAHAAGLDFQMGLDVVQGLFKGAHGLFTGLFARGFQRAVENLFSGALLAVVHETVHELGDQTAVVQRIGQHFPLRDRTFTGHDILLENLCVSASPAPQRPGAPRDGQPGCVA